MNQSQQPPQFPQALVHARPALRRGARGFVWMTHAPPTLTARLFGSTIDNTQWRWVSELERYVMPECQFCTLCFESKSCVVFEEEFQRNTPSVVCATTMQNGYMQLMALRSALEEERSIRPSDLAILEDLKVQKHSAGGKLDALVSDFRSLAEKFLSKRVGVPAPVVHRVSGEFLNAFRSTVAHEARAYTDGVFPFGGPSPHAEQQQPSDAAELERVRRKWMLQDTVITRETIQARFTAFASLAHPDHGGSTQAMTELLRERELLLKQL